MFEAILTFIALSWIFVELTKYWIKKKYNKDDKYCCNLKDKPIKKHKW